MDPFLGGVIGGVFGNGLNAWANLEANRNNAEMSQYNTMLARHWSLNDHKVARQESLTDHDTAWHDLYGPTPTQEQLYMRTPGFGPESNKYYDQIKKKAAEDDQYGYMLNATPRHKAMVEHDQRSYDLTNKRYQARLDEEREYNHPKNQVKRFIEAGLNPGLLYGGALAGNQGVSVPSMSQNSAPQRRSSQRNPTHPETPREMPYFFDPTLVMRLIEQNANLAHLTKVNAKLDADTTLSRTQATVARTQAAVNKAHEEQARVKTSNERAGWLMSRFGEVGRVIARGAGDLARGVDSGVRGLVGHIGRSIRGSSNNKSTVRQGLGSRR